jgi:hypothetical protein
MIPGEVDAARPYRILFQVLLNIVSGTLVERKYTEGSIGTTGRYKVEKRTELT